MKYQGIPREKVKDLYNGLETMWGDPWHAHTKQWLTSYLKKLTPLAQAAEKVLHIGSAGDDYGLHGDITCHVDVAEKRLIGVPGSIIGDTHSLPVLPNSIDFCTCVGSVINYCRAAEALLEISLIIKLGGYLVVEFESSRSWEYFGQNVFGKGVASTRTFYAADPECDLWIYSPRFIKKLISKYGFVVKDESRSQILSSIAYRIKPNYTFATKFSSFDAIASKIPIVKDGAGNVILLCQKVT